LIHGPIRPSFGLSVRVSGFALHHASIPPFRRHRPIRRRTSRFAKTAIDKKKKFPEFARVTLPGARPASPVRRPIDSLGPRRQKAWNDARAAQIVTKLRRCQIYGWEWRCETPIWGMHRGFYLAARVVEPE